jgi:pyruvate-formate lyase-activating enzyme
MFVLFETNGYGLTPANLEAYESAGVDSFWLDIKAYDADVHKRLCGVSNARILELPAEILDRGFMLEVLSLYIPGWVEGDQLVKIAELLVEADPEIPFTLLAFFPEYKLIDNRPPTTMEMVRTYLALKDAGLKRIKIGNCGVFAHTRKDWNLLLATVGPTGIG